MKTLPNEIALNLDSNAEVSVKASIAPIEHTLSNFHVEWDALANLRVAEPEKRHPISIFQSFLPSEPVSVGECWQIEKTSVMVLLRQLNPNPNLDMHMDSGDSRGLWACLRAYNDRFADIAFRIHAEFKLEDGWLTPSQFAGNLIIDRLERRIDFFEMSVPAGTVNLDIGWKEDKEASYSITDAGFCSQMELRAGARDVAQNIEFVAAITPEAAECTLAERFYKSEQINWVPPDQASALAAAEVKLIHAISIDGPLADESC
ncbi:hypothetical protein C6503_01135 [Candidatus Poribacteria bacterium]|nr:MAG: hypothetical protein C6503_01135 [Candidatus Poribacteria bacterium]